MARTFRKTLDQNFSTSRINKNLKNLYHLYKTFVMLQRNLYGMTFCFLHLVYHIASDILILEPWASIRTQWPEKPPSTKFHPD